MTELEPQFKHFLSSGYFIGGPAVDNFENSWADYCGSEYAVGLGNGLDALTLSLKALGISSGDEVIVPSNTYIATWLAVSNCNAQIVPVEPNPDSYNIEAEEIVKKITPKTKAIIPVHLYGAPAQMPSILNVARKYGLYVIEDAAQAHGAAIDNKKIGSHGDIVAWSFYPSKNLGALGDAGAITTNCADIAQKIRMMANYGSKIKYKNEIIGVNSRLDPIQAVVLSTKLAYLDRWNKNRYDTAKFYNKQLQSLPLKLPKYAQNINHVYHQFIIECENRDDLMRFLHRRGIETMVHYPVPPFKQKAYKHLNLNISEYKIASGMSNRMLSLPISPVLTTEDKEYVIEAVDDFFKLLQ